MYSSKNIGFIISDVDTVAFYEKKGQENVQKVWEEAASKMSQMNRVQQIEIIQGRMFPNFFPIVIQYSSDSSNLGKNGNRFVPCDVNICCSTSSVFSLLYFLFLWILGSMFAGLVLHFFATYIWLQLMFVSHNIPFVGFNELKSGLQDFFKGFKENDVSWNYQFLFNRKFEVN